MFEGKLTSVLNKLLGEYVHGISAKDLSVAVFKGDVVLKNLRLKTEALNALDLPFVVRSGLVGKLSLQIPWRALGKQPVVATIERLYVVAGFADEVDGDAALTVEEAGSFPAQGGGGGRGHCRRPWGCKSSPR